MYKESISTVLKSKSIHSVISANDHYVLVRCKRIERVERIRLASLDSRGGVLAVAGGALGDGLGLRAGLGALELLADGLDGSSAGAGDGGGTAEVGVDTGKDLTVVGLDVLDDDGTGDAVLAVTAGTVELAEVHDG